MPIVLAVILLGGLGAVFGNFAVYAATTDYTTSHIRVWSEWPELSRPDGKLVDCPEGSYLAALVAAGVPTARFKLGVDTPQERERFEAAHPAGTTLDIGDIGYTVDDYSSRTLYGVQLHPAVLDDLPRLLSTPGMLVVVGGEGDGLPFPYFTGRHSTAYEVIADVAGHTRVVIADPLRPSGAYPLDMPANAIEIITLRLEALLTDGGSSASNPIFIRYAMVDEFNPYPYPNPNSTASASPGPSGQ
jgi:hypothetical protein